MKLWLDDQINDPDAPDRHVPDGWYGCRTSKQAIEYINTGVVTEISLDHDLGDEKFGTGYDVAKAIEEGAYLDMIPPMKWNIHSSNPVGRKNMEQAMMNAERYWRNHEM